MNIVRVHAILQFVTIYIQIFPYNDIYVYIYVYIEILPYNDTIYR